MSKLQTVVVLQFILASGSCFSGFLLELSRYKICLLSSIRIRKKLLLLHVVVDHTNIWN